MGVLDGRVAIITGAGQGIGAALARAYAREGALLVLNDLGVSLEGSGSDEGPVQQIVAELNASGEVAVADTGDIADVATGERLVRTAVEKFGKLDIVVNPAGIVRDRMIYNMSEEEWDAVIRVHLKGHFSTVRPAAAYFRQQANPNGHYRIINFTSDSGLQGAPGQANYAAAKMGIVGLTYSLANGLARFGVTANAIAPGAATRLTLAAIQQNRSTELTEEELTAMSPDNVAPLLVYLASERSDWLTGRTLGAAGHEVSLFNNPEKISEIRGKKQWEFEELAGQLETSFRPLADGLPRTVFAPRPKG